MGIHRSREKIQGLRVVKLNAVPFRPDPRLLLLVRIFMVLILAEDVNVKTITNKDKIVVSLLLRSTLRLNVRVQVIF
jgi:hypothetical protein